MNRLSLLLISLTILTSSCNDDFPINSDWSDNTLVMGILCTSDTAQYIKINKSFLGEGDVYEMAKVSDSIQYASVLDVSLIEYSIISTSDSPFNESNWKRTTRDTIKLVRTDEIRKSEVNPEGEAGTFATDHNYLYKTTAPLVDGYKYKLYIKIPGKIQPVWAETYMISKLVTSNPSINESRKIFMNEGYTMKWESAIYAKIYQPKIRFNYIEFANGDTVDKNITIEYPMQTVDALRTPDPYETGIDLNQSVGGSDFYKNLAQKIESNQQVKRRFKSLDFIFLAGGDDFNTYLNVSQTELSYGQSTPEFSNIQNGNGLFDNRFRYEIKGRILSVSSIDSLVNGSFTKHLNFDVNLAQ
ncbi:MAG: hypothetical protein A2W97_12835 [Bacteroidetes bacterium GWE2_40_63]|nr:MAG: hypothetical protein A2W84_07130 [Bacteroidetes bacterium GWC2_40_13]OFX75049.1 MAG: hypothetical protein A2W96_16170 [Bacteroidetes bacterium GWD2_40_43]OFX89616.1 MAG: hypothetical protein A2W97_12835 [Bacteroidetes bacterium GWE2_40_63]OFY24135.1 MAG: hypothetical protein A2W88_14270 [Bacteroidetes bacterium GWF2_40_13]HBO73895.1 hypothetical protein [Marinilabiliales bacterium]